MAGKLSRWLALVILLTAAARPALGQATPEPAKAAEPQKRHGWFEGEKRRASPESPEFENVRKALDALSPEQRKRFQENFWRWANLSPEEKKSLRDRDVVRKKFMEEEIGAALKELGLELEGERRESFIKRYGEERRKIEEQLRKEMSEKRKPLVREVLAKLKEEFATPAVPVAPAQ